MATQLISLDGFGGLAGVGILMAGAGFAWAQFKSGASKAKDDLIDTYKETVEADSKKISILTSEKTTLITDHQKQINEMNVQLGKLQGLQEANEKKIEEYLSILQGRNPEQVQFMKFMVTNMTECAKYIKESRTMFAEIKEKCPSMGKKK